MDALQETPRSPQEQPLVHTDEESATETTQMDVQTWSPQDRCSPGVPVEQHSPVCNHARVNTSQPPVPPLCLPAPALRGYQKWLSAPALRGYWKVDIDSLSSSRTTFSDLSFASGALRRVVTPAPALASSEVI
ncbi:hypothetical protein MRX96_057223 [Rhipicephalus microplus]